MKNRFLLFIAFASCIPFAFSQKTQKVKTSVKNATVFLDKAQIERTVKVPLKKGITTLNFEKLSPFIDAKSIQVKTDANIHILAVNHKKNYLNETTKSDKIKALELQLKNIEDKITLNKTETEIVNQNLDFLQKNKSIGGKNETLTVTNLKQTADYYASQYKKLKLEALGLSKKSISLRNEKSKINKEIRTISSKKTYPTGEIFVKVETTKAENGNFEITYLVGNVSWYPSYDIKATNINEPIQIVYKANLQQNSQIDWTNIDVNFSSDNPTTSGVAPNLQPYKLSFNQIKKRKEKINYVEGTVISSTDNSPLPGASVSAIGSNIGTSTDFDGKYSLSIPNHVNSLKVSYHGFKNQTKNIYSENINFNLKEDQNQLDEVVVAYGSKNNKIEKALSGRAAGVSVVNADNMQVRSIKQEEYITTTINQTAVNFNLNKKRTITSNVKSKEIKLTTLYIPAEFQYFTVPKIDKSAYLVAKIKDWEKYQLLDGETNIFFDNTFKSKGILDLSSVENEIVISLGVDKQININRTQVTENSSRKFLSKNIETQKHWKIDIKNNKNQNINIQVLDQVPVSIIEAIKVEVNNTSDAKYNTKTGELKWNLNIPKQTAKTLNVQYSVKHPKNRKLIIE